MNEICQKCGGLKKVVITYTQPFTGTSIRLCGCAPEKHNGMLGGGSWVYFTDGFYPEGRGIRIDGKYSDDPGIDQVRLRADQALSLLDWLEQNRAELERLAKE